MEKQSFWERLQYKSAQRLNKSAQSMASKAPSPYFAATKVMWSFDQKDLEGPTLERSAYSHPLPLRIFGPSAPSPNQCAPRPESPTEPICCATLYRPLRKMDQVGFTNWEGPKSVGSMAPASPTFTHAQLTLAKRLKKLVLKSTIVLLDSNPPKVLFLQTLFFGQKMSKAICTIQSFLRDAPHLIEVRVTLSFGHCHSLKKGTVHLLNAGHLRPGWNPRDPNGF